MPHRVVPLLLASLLLGACASQTPSDPAYARYLRLGDDLASRGDPVSAASLYDKATQLPGAGLEAWLKLGQARLAAQDPSGAERAYQQALNDAPDNADALLGLGTAQLRLGRYERAVISLTQAADRGNQPQAWSRLGVAQVLRGQTSPAQAAFEKARTLQPQNLDTQCNLALAQALGGQPDAAMQGIRAVTQSPRVLPRHQRNALLVAVLAGRESALGELSLDQLTAAQRQGLLEQARQIKALADPAAQARAMGLVD
ncbi:MULTISPECIES: tetratricopeptide repeat protein [unclassified Pseudomonas]|uniref:tetratricopeptide repeat protein n=1 Tax=unclassified Pseudomonas TaxID=196821 RepID=UPI000BD0ABBD|nr:MULTISPECIES: tetratricopeptide repeat protein [unclassified Pseudomonas]PVZ12529.1 Tfp pilus assembly protein PilF [Pseudomonas sp. URIL14HWK12:I12]PVZ23319.1 Tfp pilus assembly protein PilF [Pseudomonas sp. URIL14HWK12:I10]PVZ32649.1 Tfp pilus assembly protein PilF [Pseudomonas sp. URIL14HWK12:I11]SNZ13803.1 Tfp pilus assembly protein PilF [Pseudomonas sp. URIL14HWK12:I9]